MGKSLVFLFGILMCSNAIAFAQQDEMRTLLVSGTVFAEDSSTALAFVHLRLQRNHNVTFTDQEGFFSINARPGDLLKFTAVGRQVTYLAVPEGFQGETFFANVVMLPRTVELPTAIIQDSRELEEVQTVVRVPERKPVRIYGWRTYEGEQVPVAPTIMNPVSLLLDKYGKEAKAKRLIAADVREKQAKEQASLRFSEQWVYHQTGLLGDELREFMAFCGFDPYFILQATEYDLTVATKKKLEEFVKWQQVASSQENQ